MDGIYTDPSGHVASYPFWLVGGLYPRGLKIRDLGDEEGLGDC